MLRRAMGETKPTGSSAQEEDSNAVVYYDDDTPIDGAFFIEDSELRLDPGKSCSHAFFRLSGAELSFADPQSFTIQRGTIVQHLKQIPLSRIYLVVPSHNCALAAGGFWYALLVDTREEIGDWVIALEPTHYDYIFTGKNQSFLDKLANPHIIKSIEFNKEEWLGNYDEKIVNDFHVANIYTYFTIREFNRSIFSSAISITGNIYSRKQISDAASDLFQQKSVEANIFGIKTTHLLFIQISPIIASILFYVFYRRLREIAKIPYVDIEEPWLFLKIDNFFDYALSLIWMVSPAAFILYIYWSFADINGAVLRVFGGYIDVRFEFYSESFINLHKSGEFQGYFATLLLILMLFILYSILRAQIYLFTIIQRYRVL